MTPIELLFDRPSAARLTATHGIMRRISHNFPGATDEPYSGPTLLPWKGFVIAFGLLLGIMAILLGSFAFTHRSRAPGNSVMAAENLDVEQTVNVSAAQVRSGTFIAVTVAHTDESIQVHIPTKAKEGTRLRLRGKGRASPQGGPSGDLYLLIHIIS